MRYLLVDAIQCQLFLRLRTAFSPHYLLRIMTHTIKSPSVSSTSSFDFVQSSRSRSSTLSARSLSADSEDFEGDDEIIWNLSSPTASRKNSIVAQFDEDDFVVLGRVRAEPSTAKTTQSPCREGAQTPRSADQVTELMGALSLNASQKDNQPKPTKAKLVQKGSQKPSAPARTDTPKPPPSPSPSPSRRAQKRRARKATKREQQLTLGLGSRTLVDDVSDLGDTSSVYSDRSAYDDAVEYITT